METAVINLLKKEFLNAVYTTDKTNIKYFSSFDGSRGSLLLINKPKLKGFLFTDGRYVLEAEKIVPPWVFVIDIAEDFKAPWQKLLKKLKIKKIGFEASSISHADFLKIRGISPKIKFKDISEKTALVRVVKTPQEIEKIKKAQKIAEKIFGILKRTLCAGETEKQIEGRIKLLAAEFGADDVSFNPIIAINEHSACPHHTNTQRKLKKGSMILIDMGIKYKGYCSDMTRVLFTRSPSDFEQKIYSIVLEAQKNAIKNIKAGIKGIEADNLTRKIIKKAGYSKYFTHASGHGVGLDIHELPNLSEKYEGKFPENSVVTVEPGIYLPGKFGIRIEDMMIVGKNSCINLTKTPKSIQKCIITLR